MTSLFHHYLVSHKLADCWPFRMFICKDFTSRSLALRKLFQILQSNCWKLYESLCGTHKLAAVLDLTFVLSSSMFVHVYPQWIHKHQVALNVSRNHIERYTNWNKHWDLLIFMLSRMKASHGIFNYLLRFFHAKHINTHSFTLIHHNASWPNK